MDNESVTKNTSESIKNGQETTEANENYEQSNPIISILPIKRSVIYCYVLSMWDNIVGPKPVYVWKSKNNANDIQGNNMYQKRKECPDDHKIIEDNITEAGCSMVFDDIIKYVAEHSISLGDVNKFGNKHVTSWLTTPHQNIAFLSIRFALEEAHPKIPCSLSCVTYYGQRHKLRSYLEICLSQMQIIANKFSILLKKEGLSGANKVTDDLTKLTNTVSSLMRGNLCECIPENLPETPANRHLAALMLTSHLQTQCSTLIIASSINVANKAILWLSQFSPDKNLSSSCICLSDKKCLYSNGPFIQAVIRDHRGEVDLPTTNMLCAGLPLTIVDLTQDTVRQFAPSATQQRMCMQVLHSELADLYGGCKSGGTISRSIFRPVEVIAPLIKNFLQEWSCLAECEPSIRREYLHTFKQSLYYNALSVTVFVRNKCNDIRTVEKADAQEFTPGFLVREIKSFLQLDESDIKVLLAEAESFDPGITSFIFR